MNQKTGAVKESYTYFMTVLLTFAALQFIVVVLHEHTHSTVAWLLGFKRNPLEIVWGNPLMLTGWDEGVDYRAIFGSGHAAAAALTGVSPLIVHAAIVIAGITALKTGAIRSRKWLFHILYWFIIANLMELTAYINMRAFAEHGDIGIFNRGLGLSPWIVFTAGSLAVFYCLYALFSSTLPAMLAVFAVGNPLKGRMIIVMTAFLLFIWGSGMRVILACYPDPQWMFGLAGFIAFVAVLAFCRPEALQNA